MRRLPAILHFCATSLTLTNAPHAQTPDAFPMPAVAPRPSTTSTTSTPSAAPSDWRNSTVFGVTSGLGSPYGLLGAFVGFFPSQHLQLEVGGGYSTGFGPSVAALGRVGVNPGNRSFLALGVGVSTNFTDFACPDSCASPGNRLSAARCMPPGAPSVVVGSASALWLDVEVSEDVRVSGAFGGRLAAGFGLLLKPSAFPAALGCAAEGLGRTPCDVGAARTRDEATWVGHVRIDLYAVIVRSDR
jgi:hypothetical protein